MDFFNSVFEDSNKMTIAILAVGALASFFLMRHYASQCDPIRDDLKNALLQYKKPSVFYRFLMTLEKEQSEKYYNMKVHLLKIDGAPTNVCTN